MADRGERPAFETRSGSVKAAVWEHEKGGETYYGVTFQRSYQKDGVWKNTGSFSPLDLMELIRCALVAQAWIATRGKTTVFKHLFASKKRAAA